MATVARFIQNLSKLNLDANFTNMYSARIFLDLRGSNDFADSTAMCIYSVNPSFSSNRFFSCIRCDVPNRRNADSTHA
jgi:hypothetical protein